MSALVWRGEEASRKVLEAALAGLTDAGEVLRDTADQRVPVDEGTLRNSGSVTVDRGSMTVAVSYDTPYAVRQHEDLTIRHANGRQAKYLESALRDKQRELQRHIADKIRAALASGGR